MQTLKSISGKFGFDPLTNLPTFNLELGDIERPEYTLEEIFKYLMSADKPCIVAIDEFQQIGKYPEKNIEALLRTHIQKIENSHFIFAGSERSMMQAMFLSSARPFYRSSDVMELDAIDKDIYVAFISEHFERRDRRVSTENAGKVSHTVLSASVNTREPPCDHTDGRKNRTDCFSCTDLLCLIMENAVCRITMPYTASQDETPSVFFP